MAHQTIVGVDVGGTFTDFVFLFPNGRLQIYKRPSTPHDPSEAILDGLRHARAAGWLAPGFALVHGTTVATNALLERRGAATALITTRGFRDVLLIARQNRETLYSLHPSRSAPLLPREFCVEIGERLDWQGEVLETLDAEALVSLLDQLHEQGVESVAVSLLFSFLNPVHERCIGDAARRRGFCVSLSHEIAPEPREYERAATTAANAYVAPILTRYLARFESRLAEVEAQSLRIMQSNGGALSASEAGALAIKTALSGPAGGVIAAAELGRQTGYRNLLTFDMGGTSTDVALLREGVCAVAEQAILSGVPLRTPMLDIHTVGAGGGSLVWLDAAGGLRVGPQSAGADPGPVAYGRGETLTVTDANVLLGRLPGSLLLAGSLPLEVERVRAYFEPLAQQLNRSPEAAALGVIEVANAAMARALRHISVERGHDPSEFALLSFGGAGGLHACDLAEALGISTVLIPRYPGAFSAVGLAYAEVRREYVRAFAPMALRSLTAEMQAKLEATWRELEAQAMRDLQHEGIPAQKRELQYLGDLRYQGQSFTLRIPLHERDNPLSAIATFHARHRERYGHASPRELVELLACRLIATGALERPSDAPPETTAQKTGISQTKLGTNRGWVEASIYQRAEFAPDQTLLGPALLLQEDATTYLPPRWEARLRERSVLELRLIPG